jgi:N-acetylmuramoyl-L-alanine amidase
MSRVILVYAHGGDTKDPGAVNGQVTERDWIKEFFDKFLIPEFKKEKIEVVTVQQKTWYTIDKQVNEVYKVGDIAISCHLNAGPATATGTETLYCKGSKNGEKLAKLVNDAIVGVLKSKDRGLKGLTREDRGGRLVQGTKPPCVLTELFFLSNNEDLKKSYDLRDEMATAMVKAYKAFRTK